MNAITPHAPRPVSLRPTTQTRAMSDLIGRFTNRLEDTDVHGRKCISAGSAPGERERLALMERKAELLACLQPDPDRARKVIGALLGSFPSYGEDDETARFILAASCRACAKAPAWALEEASGRFLENRVRIQWDMAKRPTPPQILAEAMHCTLAVEAELYKLGQILDAEIVDADTTEDERKQALAHWAHLRRSISANNVVNDRTDDDVEHERAEMRKANELIRRKEAAQRAAAEEEKA